MANKGKQRVAPKPAELIEANKRQIEIEMQELDIMEWYANQYKGATTK